MFAAYENGKPPKRFAIDPTGPYTPPVTKRMSLPSCAAKKPVIALIIGVLILVAHCSYMMLGLGSEIDAYAASARSNELIGNIGNRRITPARKKELRSELGDSQVREIDLRIRSIIWEIVSEKVILYASLALLFVIIHRWKRLNLKSQKLFEVLYREPGAKA